MDHSDTIPPAKAPLVIKADAPPEMVEGYLDGFKDDRDNLPASLGNRSETYQFGWLNGRDDRVGKPRASFTTISAEADRIIRGGQS